jgi:hypothetical protein
MTLHLPEEPVLLAIGTVNARHAHLDHTLKLAISELSGVPLGEVLDDNPRTGSRKLRQQVLAAARGALIEQSAVTQLEDFLSKCESATKRRNSLIHDISVLNHAGEPMFRTSDREWKFPPKVSDLEDLAADLVRLVNELMDALDFGFLRQALAARRGACP